MAEFVCKFGTANGEILQKVYVADSEKVLRQQMEEKGYYIFGIERKLELKNLWKSFFVTKRKKISDKQFVVFNQELAALVHSGLPLLRCLELLFERIENQEFRVILEDVYRQVKGGTSLSEAFGSHPDVFPRVYTASILAGEKSGTLEQVIRRFLSYFKIILGIRTKVISSMIYPLLLLGLAFGVILVLITYVIPKFSEFYTGFGGQLPVVTQILIGTSMFIKAHFFWFGLAIVLLFIFYKTFVTHSNRAQLWLSRLNLKLPLIGNIWTKFSISQLMRTLHTLLAGGIPLVNSIDVAAGAVSNRLISEELGHVSQRVKEGDPLWSSLQRTGLMTHMSIEMVKVGEETGSLEEMLKNISDFYDEEIDTNLTNLLAIVEPVMLIAMGLVIATILLAMYYPLFTAISTIRE